MTQAPSSEYISLCIVLIADPDSIYDYTSVDSSVTLCCASRIDTSTCIRQYSISLLELLAALISSTSILTNITSLVKESAVKILYSVISAINKQYHYLRVEFEELFCKTYIKIIKTNFKNLFRLERRRFLIVYTRTIYAFIRRIHNRIHITHTRILLKKYSSSFITFIS